jgi:hypothetical protein
MRESESLHYKLRSETLTCPPGEKQNGSFLSAFLCNRPILRGQIISFLIAGTGIFADQLSDVHGHNNNFPALLAALNYLVIAIYIGSTFYWHNNTQPEHDWTLLRSG